MTSYTRFSWYIRRLLRMPDARIGILRPKCMQTKTSTATQTRIVHEPIQRYFCSEICIILEELISQSASFSTSSPSMDNPFCGSSNHSATIPFSLSNVFYTHLKDFVKETTGSKPSPSFSYSKSFHSSSLSL